MVRNKGRERLDAEGGKTRPQLVFGSWVGRGLLARPVRFGRPFSPAGSQMASLPFPNEGEGERDPLLLLLLVKQLDSAGRS